MKKLLEGIARFHREVRPVKLNLFQELSKGQNPDVLMIGCADSRLVPCQKFGIEAGEVFTHRNPGAIVPVCGSVMGGEEASITLAVKLGVRHICVVAHTDCGAMKALADPTLAQDMPALSRMLRESRTDPQAVSGIADGTIALLALTQLHVVQQLKNLLTYPQVQSGLERGELELHGLLFDIENAAFLRYHQESGDFRMVSECSADPTGE